MWSPHSILNTQYCFSYNIPSEPLQSFPFQVVRHIASSIGATGSGSASHCSQRHIGALQISATDVLPVRLGSIGLLVLPCILEFWVIMFFLCKHDPTLCQQLPQETKLYPDNPKWTGLHPEDHKLVLYILQLNPLVCTYPDLKITICLFTSKTCFD